MINTSAEKLHSFLSSTKHIQSTPPTLFPYKRFSYHPTVSVMVSNAVSYLQVSQPNFVPISHISHACYMTHQFYKLYLCKTPGRQNILKEREEELPVFNLLLFLDECVPIYVFSVFMLMSLKMVLQQIGQGVVQALYHIFKATALTTFITVQIILWTDSVTGNYGYLRTVHNAGHTQAHNLPQPQAL